MTTPSPNSTAGMFRLKLRGILLSSLCRSWTDRRAPLLRDEAEVRILRELHRLLDELEIDIMELVRGTTDLPLQLGVRCVSGCAEGAGACGSCCGSESGRCGSSAAAAVCGVACWDGESAGGEVITISNIRI